MIPDRVLFIRFGVIGDVLLTTPLLRLFHERFPQAKIDFLIKKKYSPLVDFHPLVSEVLTIQDTPSFGDLLRVRRKIKSKHYDLIFDLQKHWRSYFVSVFLNAGVSRYKKYTLRRFALVYLGKNYFTGIPSRVPYRYFTVFGSLKLKWQNRKIELHLSQEIRQKASELLPAVRKSKFVAIAPGAGRNTKKWLLENYCELIAIIEKKHNVQFILLGGEGDKETCNEIKRSVSNSVFNLCGRTTLLETAAIIDDCYMIICNDTGLMHMASAFDCRIIAIYGPTVQEFGFFPFSENATVVEHPNLHCRPCSYHGSAVCPQGHFRCMQQISPQAVFQAVEKLWN